jgi:putative membrane protein
MRRLRITREVDPIVQRLIARWFASSVAVAAVAWLLPGIRAGEGRTGAITVAVAAAFLGLANTCVKPVLQVLSCPLILLTLGLFLLVINAAMLMLASWASRGVGYPLEVDGWGTAVLGSILISIVTWFLSLFVGKEDRKRDQD